VPELPDVEQYRLFFDRHAAGKKVRAVWCDPSILRNASAQSMDGALRGRRIDHPERFGKWLMCWTDGPALLLHFGMTGELVWSGDEPQRHRWDRLALRFEEGDELRYRNMRKLGGVWLAHDRAEAAGVLGRLGPDALAIGRKEFIGLLGRRRGGVKAALMDQRFVAGVGNLIADETLWQARLHPRRRIDSLSAEERDRLFGAMHSVLRRAVEAYDFVARRRSWLTHVRGQPGARCPRCRTPLARTVAAGRTTYFCPSCQAP
jgi:formamidopyrimidine-DNA glycosylase